MKRLTSAEIYEAGYAVPSYDILADRRMWRFQEEEWNLPSNAVRLHTVLGISVQVGLVADVRAAAEKQKKEQEFRALQVQVAEIKPKSGYAEKKGPVTIVSG